MEGGGDFFSSAACIFLTRSDSFSDDTRSLIRSTTNGKEKGVGRSSSTHRQVLPAISWSAVTNLSQLSCWSSTSCRACCKRRLFGSYCWKTSKNKLLDAWSCLEDLFRPGKPLKTSPAIRAMSRNCCRAICDKFRHSTMSWGRSCVPARTSILKRSRGIGSGDSIATA